MMPKHARNSIIFLAATVFSFSHVYASTTHQGRGFDVLHYRAEIRPNIVNKMLSGSESIQIKIDKAGIDNIVFNADGLNVSKVTHAGKALSFSVSNKQLQIQLPDVASIGEKYTLDIQYDAKPVFGMQFYPEREEVYTIFSTSQWLVVIDAPDERANLDLHIQLPEGYQSVGNGKLKSISSVKDGVQTHHWQQNDPVPSYLFGFAASRYQEKLEKRNGIHLRYLSKQHSPEQLKQIFANTADMFQFFSQRSGIPYRGDYAQALVADTIGQEMAGFALMSEEYGASVLKDETKTGLIAHEVAHQWWGNQVTCRDWNHFWLNEGFATFMTAAYLQHRFGDETYRAQVLRWQTRVEKLRAEGKDHSLVYEQWIKPSSDDRAVVYQKGAYVLHQLRLELGEKVFWRSIRVYTKQYYGKSVTTNEFKRAMEKASKRDLSAFFTKWIDSPVVNTSKQ